MVNQKVQEKLNEQIQKELYSAYLYLSMETYFLSEGLDGFANWFHVQAQEERDHAMLIFNYLNRIGGRIELRQIDAPPVEFESICHVLKQTLEHEQMVTQSINDLVECHGSFLHFTYNCVCGCSGYRDKDGRNTLYNCILFP
jgi:ferritin